MGGADRNRSKKKKIVGLRRNLGIPFMPEGLKLSRYAKENVKEGAGENQSGRDRKGRSGGTQGNESQVDPVNEGERNATKKKRTSK